MGAFIGVAGRVAAAIAGWASRTGKAVGYAFDVISGVLEWNYGSR